MLYKLEIRTGERVEFQDITHKIQDLVSSSGVQSGLCHLFVTHTTAGVTVNENADPSVVEDMKSQLDIIAPQHNKYRHMEGNSPAHIKASLIGDSETLIIDNGSLVLGTWQGIFFCEFDGPRHRTLMVKIFTD